MYSIFIPEDKAGTIICARVGEIPRTAERRQRLSLMRNCIQMVKAMGLAPSAPQTISSISYGCAADGTIGLIVVIGTPTIVATTKEPQ